MPRFQSRETSETLFERIRTKHTRRQGKFELPNWHDEFVIQQYERTAHQTAVGQVACALLELQGVVEVALVDRNTASASAVDTDQKEVALPADIKIWLEYLPAPLLITVFTTPQELAEGTRQLQTIHSDKQKSGEVAAEVNFDSWLLSIGWVLLLAQQNTKPAKIRDRVRHKLPRTTKST
jgi:hypothetical protein